MWNSVSFVFVCFVCKVIPQGLRVFVHTRLFTVEMHVAFKSCHMPIRTHLGSYRVYGWHFYLISYINGDHCGMHIVSSCTLYNLLLQSIYCLVPVIQLFSSFRAHLQGPTLSTFCCLHLYKPGYTHVRDVMFVHGPVTCVSDRKKKPLRQRAKDEEKRDSEKEKIVSHVTLFACDVRAWRLHISAGVALVNCTSELPRLTLSWPR